MNRSAGKAMKLPPPATQLSAPPSAPAKKRKMMDCAVKQLCVPETAEPRQPFQTFLAKLRQRLRGKS